jgi:phosphatidylserine/phosphatidylglycerophosphate/cardiolipin synthase-like enzyme
LIAWHVNRAEKTLDVAAYQWSNKLVHEALKAAVARGVKARLLLDRAPEKNKYVQELVRAGWGPESLRVDDQHPIFHHKFVVRDADRPETASHESGSCNFSAASESNAEDAQVVEGDPAVTAAFLAAFERHWVHARSARQAFKVER